MKPKSSGLRARRSLSFEERPLAGKTFYVDVKSASAKSKIIQRIQKLGGQIEDFLSKDLTLLITDKTSTQNSKEDFSQKQTTKYVPLSRGQALLLKASANQNCDANNNNNGLLQSAAKLGLRIETPTVFLRDSSKHLQKLKAETSRLDTSMSGLSPITWDSEKENGPVLKVEDEDGLYRPLFKQFETFPQIFYNETGSPFDVGIVLTKTKESNNQSKKKSAGGVLRGGYCESCDHWYKCSLREHLNSEKHKEFVSVTENFKTLNETSSNLPNLKTFVGKYGLKGDNESQEIICKTPDSNSEFPGFESYQENVTEDISCAQPRYKINYPENLVYNNESNQYSEKEIKSRHSSKTEPIADRKLNYDPFVIHHCQPVGTFEEDAPVQSIEKFKEISALNELKCNNNELKSENSFSNSSSKRMGRKFSVDDVIKSVTDNEYYFSSCNDNLRTQNPLSKTSCIVKTSEMSSNVNSHHSLSVSSHSIVDQGSRNATRDTMSIDKTEEKSKQDTEMNPARLQNIPLMYFSSSSFGDNGVSNVLSFLNSQHSGKSCDKEGNGSGGRFLDDDNFNVEGRRNSSWSFDKLSDRTDSKENVPSSSTNVQGQHQDSGNVLEYLIDDVSCNDNEMPILQAEVNTHKMEVDFDLMPVLQSYDSEDSSRVLDKLVNENKVQKPPSVVSIPLPEYSNITEESLQDKSQIESKHILDQNLQTSYNIPMLNFNNSIVKDGVQATPDKNLMSNLKSKIYESRTNSGSTIRNWLLPNDDTGSIRSVQSPGNLNDTLVNTSYIALAKPQMEGRKDQEKGDSSGTSADNFSFNEIKETGESSKVADWIQKQDFVIAQNDDENYQNGFEANILDAGLSCSIDEKQQAINERDLKACSEKQYGSERVDIDARSYVWSDSCTSISDCTLDNFRSGGCLQDSLHTENSNSAVKVIRNVDKPDVPMEDEMSQDSNISAKSGLTSIVTAKGIKITGLSSLSSHYFHAADSDIFTGTESSTVAFGNSRRNSDCSFAESKSKTESIICNITSDDQLTNDHANICASQVQQQKNGSFTCSYENSSELHFSSETKSYFEEDIKSSQEMTNQICAKGKRSIKKQSQTKKPRAVKSTKSKKQAQSHSLLNQVLTANMYSPVSSYTDNSPNRNSYMDHTFSDYQQLSPYSQNSSPHVQKDQGSGHSQRNQYLSEGHLGTTLQHGYPQGNGEIRMMDLLLSPGEKMNKFQEGKFQQNLVSQQQCLGQQNNMYQSNNVDFNGGTVSNSLAQQNIYPQFSVLPFSGDYQNHWNSHSNKENNPHFLSSNSNFFMHNWNTGTSCHQQNYLTHQEPAKPLDLIASPGNMAHDLSKSNGSLQTIEMSHIADSNGGCENNFNFNIADTKKLNSNNNSKKKPKEKKQTAQRKKKGSAVSQNTTALSVSHVNSQCLVSDLKPVENTQSVPSMPLHYTQYPNVSSQCTLPLHTNSYFSQSPSAFSPNYCSMINQTCHGMTVNTYSNNQHVNVYGHTNTGNVYNNNSINMYGMTHSVNMYNTTQTGDTKLTIRRACGANPQSANKQPKHDLMQYWNVRKAGDCRLVFSSNVVSNGKRKAEAETPTKMYLSPVNNGQSSNPASKRRKCLVY